MRSLVAWATNHPVFSNLLMGAMLIGGLGSYWSLTVESMPEVELNRVLVTVPYPGASAHEVEEGICVKIEEALEGLQGIKNIDSTAREGFATVLVELEESITEPREVQADIRDRVDNIDTFPDDAEEAEVEEIILRHPIMMLSLFGDSPERTLHELAQSVKDDLLGSPNISQVTIRGIRDYEISIEVSEESLRKYGLTLQQVASAVRGGSLNLPAGPIKTRMEDFKIEVQGRLYRGADYRNLVVMARPDGATVFLHQVAKVTDGFVEDEVRGRYNGQRSVMIQIDKTPEQDALKIAKFVKQYIKDKQVDLPQGIGLVIFNDLSKMITDRIGLLTRNGLQGLFLVLLSLWLFLNFKLSFWVALGIPVAFACSGIIMLAGGQTINMINLFGMIMVLGIVVDDAIVIGENIHRYREMGMGAAEAAIKGSTEMALPVFAAVSTTVAAFMPLMFVDGVLGKFIYVLPVVVIAVLVGSLIESLLVLPAHLSHSKLSKDDGPPSIFKRTRLKVEAGIAFVIHRMYAPVFKKALEWRGVTVSIGMASLALCIGLIASGTVQFHIFPRFDNQFIQGDLELSEGTTLEVTAKKLKRMEQAALKLNARLTGHTYDGSPMVQRVYSDLGKDGKAHAGRIYVVLAGPEERDMHSEEILKVWRELAGPFPEAVKISYGDMQGPGIAGHDIEIHLRGRDMTKIRAASKVLKQRILGYGGTYEVQDDFQPGKRELQIALKPEGRSLGISLQSLARQLRQGFYGTEAVRIQRGRDEVKVQVRYPKSERASLNDLYRIRVRAANGTEVPFEEVAKVKWDRGVAEIKRRNGMRRLAITAEVDANFGNAAEISESLAAGVLFDLRQQYPELKISFEGSKKANRDSMQSLKGNFAISAMAIFIILAAVFRSYLQPLLIMSVIPFGAVGAIVGHLVWGKDLTMMSFFGLVALMGVVVNDSLVLINFINSEQRKGVGVMEAIQRAGPARFRAIMLTSLTTVAGLTPMLFERSFQAQFLVPMAISLCGGLVYATFITLFLVPCLYLLMNDLRRVVYWLINDHWPTRELVEPAYGKQADLSKNGHGLIRGNIG